MLFYLNLLRLGLTLMTEFVLFWHPANRHDGYMGGRQGGVGVFSVLIYMFTCSLVTGYLLNCYPHRLHSLAKTAVLLFPETRLSLLVGWHGHTQNPSGIHGNRPLHNAPLPAVSSAPLASDPKRWLQPSPHVISISCQKTCRCCVLVKAHLF